MKGLEELEQRIREKLSAREEWERLQQKQLATHAQQFALRHERYAGIADRLMEIVVSPRMKKLAEHFDNAKFPDSAHSGRHHCACCFQRSIHFPTHVRLELAVSRDGLCENLLLLYELEILPVFFQFQGRDQLARPLDAVDEERAAMWVDDRILSSWRPTSAWGQPISNKRKTR